MLNNEKIIIELCAAAKGQGTDIEKFVSMFSEEGYMWDMASTMQQQPGLVSGGITGTTQSDARAMQRSL